jgi:hypothetical protein
VGRFIKNALLYFIVGFLFGIYMLKVVLLPSGQSLFLIYENGTPHVPL